MATSSKHNELGRRDVLGEVRRATKFWLARGGTTKSWRGVGGQKLENLGPNGFGLRIAKRSTWVQSHIRCSRSRPLSACMARAAARRPQARSRSLRVLSSRDYWQAWLGLIAPRMETGIYRATEARVRKLSRGRPLPH